MEQIRQFLNSEELLKKCRLNQFYFIRDRVFTFQRLTLFIINLVRKTLQVEINNFADNIGISDVSKQAFSQARKKLSPKVFKLLNEKFLTEFYTDNEITTFLGYRILAIDGSRIQLPSSDEIIQEYGRSFCQSGEAIPMGQASILFDVLNKVIIDASITSFITAERTLAEKHIDKITEINELTSCTKDGIKDLFLFDRGYPSIALMARLFAENKDFIFRCAKSFLPQLADLMMEGTNDTILTIKVFDKPKRKRFKSCIKIFPHIPRDSELKIRVVLFELESGKTEILVTSLFDKETFTRELLFKLYNLRWETEENNKFLKVIAQLENFSGKSKLSVEQDFYATVFTCNIANLLAQEVADDLRGTMREGIKYKYVPNKSIALGVLKDDLMLALLSDVNLAVFCSGIKRRIARCLVPIRKNRRYPRKKSPSRTHPSNCRPSI